jgi:hypothetical protein
MNIGMDIPPPVWLMVFHFKKIIFFPINEFSIFSDYWHSFFFPNPKSIPKHMDK